MYEDQYGEFMWILGLKGLREPCSALNLQIKGAQHMIYSDLLIQIVMVSPGTHLMKNHETMSITNESLLKTTRGHKLKVLEPLCNQTVDLETDDKTLCCSLLKLKYRQKQIQLTGHILTLV